MESKKTKQNRKQLIDTENILVVTREEGGWGLGENNKGMMRSYKHLSNPKQNGMLVLNVFVLLN